jgi:hypothetical protein
LILEKIENDTEVETKPPSVIKQKGAEGQHKIAKKSKQVCFSDKHCALCKKHGGQHKSHNTPDYRKYNSNGTPIKRNGGAGSAQKNGHADKNHSNQIECEGANYAQIICKEVKKAFRKHCTSVRNIVRMTQKVTAIPTTVCEAIGRIAQGNHICIKK